MIRWTPVLIGVMTLAAASVARAAEAPAPLATAYSDIARKLCAGDHKPGQRVDEHEIVNYSCRGIAGLRLDIVYSGTSLRATLRRGNVDQPKPQIGASYDIGDRIEWRGRPGAKGFSPLAAIIRLKSYDYDGDGKLGSVLEILRVTETAVCPAAFIDAASAPRANELARQIADDTAASFRCGVDAPRVVGPETTLVKDAIARST